MGCSSRALRADPAAFVANMARTDGGEITDPDGTVRERLPGPILWMWEEVFCGSINLRYLPGTEALPPDVSGHVGYGVVPWMRRRGHATRALRLMLPRAHGVGLTRVLVTCDLGNDASRGVIERAGGAFAGELPPMREGTPGRLSFWVATSRQEPE